MANFKTTADHHSASEVLFPIDSEMADDRYNQFVSSLESLGKKKILSDSLSDNEERISKLFIKNMVSSRCIIVVKAVLGYMGMKCIRIELGEAHVAGKVTEEQLKKLNDILLKSGLELIRNNKEALVEKIKSVLIEMVYYPEDQPQLKISHYLSEKLNYDYTYLANVFSETAHISIRQFIINQKIERVKKMLMYERLTLSEIAHKLHYSSVAYLSRQFKKSAGQMPSHFKKMEVQRLIGI